MRSTAPSLCKNAASFLLLAALFVASPASPGPAHAAQPQKSAAKADAAPAGEPIEISGRITVGLDKVFIKDAQGYCLVQGLDLTPFAGRHIQAKGLVIRQDQEYRTVRLLDYRIVSPDDDSPGAGGAVKQTGADKKKK
jgi:hypothetical protein